MKPKTLKALEACIKHWEKNARVRKPENASVNANDCALCGLFNKAPNGCPGCPVKKKTEYNYCNRTPFYRAHFLLREWGFNPTPENGKAFRAAARKEADFLISLRPEVE